MEHFNPRSLLKHNVFLKMAIELSSLGTCCRLKVGCILLRSDGSIASCGYNGALPGMPHCNPKTCNENQRCLHTSHAEENALNFCDGQIMTAYITDEPCLTCTRALARRGIRKVFFVRSYKSIAPQECQERDAIIKHYQIQWTKLRIN